MCSLKIKALSRPKNEARRTGCRKGCIIDWIIQKMICRVAGRTPAIRPV